MPNWYAEQQQRDEDDRRRREEEERRQRDERERREREERDRIYAMSQSDWTAKHG